MQRRNVPPAAVRALGLVAVLLAPHRAVAQTRGAVALAEQIAGLGTTSRVLMIAAHPDDEDNRLLAWLARGHHVETAYLSLTRGEGGQNLIGNELDEALGVLRTEELLAARRVDHAHQYFTRAYDFGFSKSAAESFTHWPHDSILNDVVTVVRAFRPDVIIAIFAGTPQDGHGQHQVSAIVAREAYDASGDTVRFPVARFGPAWTVSKFYRDRSYFGPDDATLTIDVGEYSPLLGESYAEVGAEARSAHKSQGFGTAAPTRGPILGYLRRDATRVNAATDPRAERSLFDGIDTTWARLAPLVPQRAVLDTLDARLARVEAQCTIGKPAALMPGLVALARAESALAAAIASRPERGGQAMLDAERTLAITRERLADATAIALGVSIDVTTRHDVAVVGQDVPVAVTLTNRGRDAVRADAVKWQSPSGAGSAELAHRVPSDSVLTDTVLVTDTVVTQPWWLVRPRHGDLYDIPPHELGIAEDARTPLQAAEAVTGGTDPDSTTVAVSHPIVQRATDPIRGAVERPMAFAPAVSVTLDQTVAYVPAGTPIDRPLHILLRSASDALQPVTVSLALPAGLAADSLVRRVALAARGVQRVDYRVTGTLPRGDARLAVTATSGAGTYRIGYIPIEYDHIRPQRLYRPATVALRAVDLIVPSDLTVAYIRGVGDNIEPALEELGLRVTVVDPTALPTTDLARYRAVVVGPRAYEASPALAANNERLLDYVRRGGTLVVQYGQYEMTAPGMMPYPITLSRPHDRVTDETAPVRVLDASSPLLAEPNRITQADFAGWVQDRSLYMPHTFDGHYHAILSTNDPGEPPNDGAILVAPVGRGLYIYTTLAFFRQLPAGVPGAARLFVNLLAARPR